MPIFEYKCNDCNEIFEILQLPGIDNDLKCKGCRGSNLKKLISAPFLPSSVGRPANDDLKCCAGSPKKECDPGAGQCPAGPCCNPPVN